MPYKSLQNSGKYPMPMPLSNSCGAQPQALPNLIQIRKNLVYELIRNDIFNIEATEKFDFLLSLLDQNN